MMFKSAPGKQGNTLVPDLAEGPGESSDGGKTGPTSCVKV